MHFTAFIGPFKILCIVRNTFITVIVLKYTIQNKKGRYKI